jgi:hypothetical protein
MVNEAMHYIRKVGVWALTGRCVIKMRLMGSMLVADLSPHNPRSRRFLRELGKNIWEQMVDPKDCSVARGIGLAIAQNRALRGLSVQTVRESEPRRKSVEIIWCFSLPRAKQFPASTSKKHIILGNDTTQRSSLSHSREGSSHRQVDRKLRCGAAHMQLVSC